jgi:thiopeptide-type bacteriocin biosynthesis protein
MTKIQRNFSPGSEWVYFKVYINSSHADEFLLNVLAPFTKNLFKKEQILKAFFIRYSDSGFHLRIRFLLAKESNFSEVVVSFYNEIKSFVSQGIVWKYDLSTYSREIERYELPLIEQVETLFSIDSSTILDIIREVDSSNNEDYRWKIAFKYIDHYLELFYPSSLEKKYAVIEKMSDIFLAEFGYNKNNLMQLNDIFRSRRKDIYEAINETEDEVLLSMYAILNERDFSLRSSIAHILSICKSNSLNIDDFIGSYIHMMINRLFPEKNRIFELLLYYLLVKHYQSEIARAKKISL